MSISGGMIAWTFVERMAAPVTQRWTPGPENPFARWLAERMAQRGVSQRAVYDRAGVAASSLTEYRRGTALPAAETVERLAAFFGDRPEDVRALVARARIGDLDLRDEHLSLAFEEVGGDFTAEELASIRPVVERAVERKRRRLRGLPPN